MLEKLFDLITRGSLRFRWVTIMITVVILVAGVFAFTQLNQELIPKIEFPQTIVLGLNPGMDADTLLEQVTMPLEEAVAAIEGVVNVETTTSNGLSLAIVRNEFGMDQEAISAQIQEVIDGLDYPAGMETPQLLTFNLSDLPIASISISAEGMSLEELKALVESEIVPQLEEVSSVAAVDISGGQELPSDEAGDLEPATAESAVELEPSTQPSVVSGEETTTPTDAVKLPDSWIQAFASQGMTIDAVSELVPEMVEGIVGFAPQLLEALTPEMLYAMSPEVLAVLPEDYFASLDPDVSAKLGLASGGQAEGLPLPESWIQALAAQGGAASTTDDLTAEIITGFANFAPAMLEELTSEMLIVMPVEALVALPEQIIAGEAPDLQVILLERIAAAQKPEEGMDPSALPAAWKSAGQARGTSLETVDDVTVEVIQGMASFAPQMLDMLSADNLRLFSAEVLGWLPESYIATLDPALQAELNALAAPVGGLGALAAAAAAPANPEELPQAWKNAGQARGIPLETVSDLTPEVIQGIAQFAPEMLDLLTEDNLRLMGAETLAVLPEDFLASLSSELQAELGEIIAAANVFIPTASITRVNGNHSLGMAIYKDQDSNTVSVSHDVFDKLEAFETAYPELDIEVVFEQSSFIEESVSGVTREGGLGAIFAVIVILIFLSGRINGKYKLSWRSTIVTAVSIPLSVFAAFAMFKWLPLGVEPLFDSLSDVTAGIPVLGAAVVALGSLFPTGLTLNIMTLSGMTVAVGRVVDDSIVVLENIYRHIQRGDDRRVSVIKGTRDVSIAIFASTATTVVVFLPIGLIGGLVGEFFLPFGIAVTYALAASFLVAITIVPTLAFLFIRKEHLPVETETSAQRVYTPILSWALNHKAATLGVAAVLLIGSLLLFSTRPLAFLPNFGDVRISTSVDLPDGTQMAETDALVMQFEDALEDIDGLGSVQTEIGGGGGIESFFFGGNIDQSAASISVTVDDPEQALELTALIREEAEQVFGNEYVVVSSGSMSSQGFGGFALVASAQNMDALEAFDRSAIDALNGVDGLANVTSNAGNADSYLRVDGEPAIRFVGELETKDTLGVTAAAKEALIGVAPDGVLISEGFESQQQTEGFAKTFQAIGISVIIVYLVMVLTLGSFVHPLTILFSLPLAIIGASVALWASGSILGLSSMIGMMMLVGIVVTNAIVLVDRVLANKKRRGMETREALVEAGRTRLRPILMTAIAAILALVPLAIGLSEGAIIASELAIVVIGGLTTSTLLTLVIVPVMFSLLDRFSRNGKGTSPAEST